MRYDFYTPEETNLMVKALQRIRVIAERGCAPPGSHKDDCPFCDIYRIAHAGQSPSCEHPGCREDVNSLRREL